MHRSRTMMNKNRFCDTLLVIRGNIMLSQKYKINISGKNQEFILMQIYLYILGIYIDF